MGLIKGRSDSTDTGGRRRTKKLADDREFDWMGVEDRRNVHGVQSHHLKRFATEPELVAWIAKNPRHRAHRGMQRRLPLVPPATEPAA